MTQSQPQVTEEAPGGEIVRFGIAELAQIGAMVGTPQIRHTLELLDLDFDVVMQKDVLASGTSTLFARDMVAPISSGTGTLEGAANTVALITSEANAWLIFAISSAEELVDSMLVVVSEHGALMIQPRAFNRFEMGRLDDQGDIAASLVELVSMQLEENPGGSVSIMFDLYDGRIPREFVVGASESGDEDSFMLGDRFLTYPEHQLLSYGEIDGEQLVQRFEEALNGAIEGPLPENVNENASDAAPRDASEPSEEER